MPPFDQPTTVGATLCPKDPTVCEAAATELDAPPLAAADSIPSRPAAPPTVNLNMVTNPLSGAIQLPRMKRVSGVRRGSVSTAAHMLAGLVIGVALVFGAARLIERLRAVDPDSFLVPAPDLAPVSDLRPSAPAVKPTAAEVEPGPDRSRYYHPDGWRALESGGHRKRKKIRHSSKRRH